MKRNSLVVVLCLSVLSISASAYAQTNLIAVRRADNTVWTKRCTGAGPASTCDSWLKLSGMFKSQPVLTWDASVRKYILVGVGVDGKTWNGTFGEEGTFDGTWKEEKSAAAASPPAIAAASPLSRRVVSVDVNGGGNFTSPVDALASITTASPTNPFLVRIMPGVYDVGVTPVQMKEFVDIEGSGELVTIITGAVDGGGFGAAVVQGSANAQLRSLAVENTFAAGVHNIAIGNFGVSPTFLHVRAVARAAGANTQNVGVFNSGGAPRLNSVTVIASGARYTYGVYNDGAATIMEDVTVEALEALHNTGVRNSSGSAAQMRRVTIRASTMGAIDPSSDSTGIYNNASSPRLQDVTVIAEGGQRAITSNAGMINVNSSPLLTNVSLEATGGTDDVGLQNKSDSSPILTNVIASGSTTGMEIVPSGATPTVVVDRSSITGGTNAIVNEDGVTLLVGASKLGGARNTTLGTWTCVGSYTDAYTALGATCN